MTSDLDRALGDALRPLKDPRPGDLDTIDRMIDRVLDAPPPPPPAVPSGAIGSAVVVVVVAGVMAIVAASLSPRAHSTQSATAPTQSAPVIASPAPATVADEIPSVSFESLPSVPQAKPTGVPHVLSAAELFSRANEERRKGEPSTTADYRLLQDSYPESYEAKASYVALGRLLLDKGGDYAGALAQFDRYLSTATTGGLQEEALIGRALALEHLGRTSEEKRAWQAVLEKYPDSIYAGEARARLDPL